MHTTSVVLLDITLEDPGEEDAFFAWWTEAKRLLAERAKPVRLDLLVGARGRYSVLIETTFPGGFNLVAKDHPWQELDGRRPRGTLAQRELRVWHDDLGTRDISTTTLRAWLAERARGERDFVFADALGADSFAAKHIPGSVSLPVATLDAEAAARVIGAKDRPVVLYCGSYG